MVITQDGNFVTDKQCVLMIWREHFSTLLLPEDSSDGVDQEVIRTAISRLKNNKAAGADGLSAELFQTGGEELIRSMHQLLRGVWSDECMPDDWSLSVLCTIFKKGDRSVCANYRSISIL